jgi:hypothetical protein
MNESGEKLGSVIDDLDASLASTYHLEFGWKIRLVFILLRMLTKTAADFF